MVPSAVFVSFVAVFDIIETTDTHTVKTIVRGTIGIDCACFCVRTSCTAGRTSTINVGLFQKRLFSPIKTTDAGRIGFTKIAKIVAVIVAQTSLEFQITNGTSAGGGRSRGHGGSL
jgi:hypothetical protein